MSLYKIVVLGDGGVGKSCLTIQFTQNHFVREYDPTIENSYRKQITIDDEACILDILDTAGQEEYAVMRDQYINSGEGFLLVFSLTSRSSFKSLSELREKILQVKDCDAEFPMVIVGNKCDLEKERLVTTAEVKEIISHWPNVGYLEASAKSRINVEESFKAIVREIKRYKVGGPSTGDEKEKKKKSSLSRDSKKVLAHLCVVS